MWAMTYYTFTTLSTVGFGDYYPTNNKERIFIAIMMLWGVMINSYVMENIQIMIHQVRTMDDDYEDYHQLSMFISTLKRYNENVELDKQFQQQITEYFEYRWMNHRNNSISTDDDYNKFDNLSERIQQSIYIDFLFRDMILVHQKIFLQRIDKDKYFFKHDELDAAKSELEKPLTEQLNDSKDLLFHLVRILEPKKLSSYDLIQK